MEDQVAELEADSKKHGTAGDEIDFALLVDGLEAEREQGITIDVAYRFFSTPRRRFIVADTPGHPQYTRNMATGASTADLAILLVDASEGPADADAPACRHRLAARHPRGGAGGEQDGPGRLRRGDFRRDRRGVRGLRRRSFSFERITAIPISARGGDNVSRRSDRMPFYSGPTLLEHLEAAEPPADPAEGPLRLPVQWVCRPDQSFRGFAGAIVSGRVAVGDEVVVAASGRASRIARILVGAEERDNAAAGQSVMVTLADEIDLSRGDIIAAKAARPSALRPVRRRSRVDGLRGPAAGPPVSAEEHDPHRAGAGDRPQVPPRCRHAGAQRPPRCWS